MEILAVEPIMTFSDITGIALLAVIITGIIFGMCSESDAEIGMIISGVCFVIAMVVLIGSAFFQVESGKYKYTVEITEESKYKELIEEGYEFKRIYDNKEIYNISGAPLEEIEK